MITGVVFTALRGLVNDRCYPVIFPQPIENVIWPAIRYRVVSEIPVVTVCGNDTGDTDETTVTVDYVAKTFGAALALRLLGRTAMQSVYPPCTRDQGGGFETFDEPTRTYRVTDEYVFHPSSVATS